MPGPLHGLEVDREAATEAFGFIATALDHHDVEPWTTAPSTIEDDVRDLLDRFTYERYGHYFEHVCDGATLCRPIMSEPVGSLVDVYALVMMRMRDGWRVYSLTNQTPATADLERTYVVLRKAEATGQSRPR